LCAKRFEELPALLEEDLPRSFADRHRIAVNQCDIG
jgi:hypothetical protein